ncbi:dynein light chain Tctex-type 5-B-like [Tubulanus polymorphus]|uniref:dynein light chain Tctex-type 5-B-like n=1 Tax=Tubulanus polymorphus TaxID=672921 RepID=UPI003DA5010B
MCIMLDPMDIKQLGSVSTVSFADEPSSEAGLRSNVRVVENNYRTEPTKKVPNTVATEIIRETMEHYLQNEPYDPEICKQLSKTIADAIKIKVKHIKAPRYKIICLVNIGQLEDQGLTIGSRCMWDTNVDTCADYTFKNNSLFAVGSVYTIYME